MTKEQALKLLRNIHIPEECEMREAFDMAVSALEHTPEMTNTMQTGQFDYVPMIGDCGAIERYAEERYEAGRKDILRYIRSDIEYKANYYNAEIDAEIASGLYKALDIIDKYKRGD